MTDYTITNLFLQAMNGKKSSRAPYIVYFTRGDQANFPAEPETVAMMAGDPAVRCVVDGETGEIILEN